MDDEKKPGLKARLIERMHDPMQLRAALCAGMLSAWYFGAFTPMGDRIAGQAAGLDLDRKRLALASEVELLRAKVARFADRLPARSDPNELAQYLLGGVRSGPLNLVSLHPEKPEDAGPFQVASVRLELDGRLGDLDAFLRWVENDRRLLRVVALGITPDSRDPDTLKAQMTILGLLGVEEAAGLGPGAPKPGAKQAPPKAKAKAKAGPAGKPSRPPIPPGREGPNR